MYCKNCRTENTNNSDFCMNCGISFNNLNVENVTKITNEMLLINNQQFNNNSKNAQSKKNKKIVIIISIILIIILILIFMLFLKNKNNNYGNMIKKNEISYNYNEFNIPKFIDGSFSSNIINSSDDVLKALESIKDEMKIKDISKELKLLSEEISEDITYYKFEQIYNDISVYNQNIIIMVDKQGKILGLSGYYIPDIDIDITPQKNKEEIEIIIKNSLGDNSNIVSNELYIWAGYNFQNLVYVVKGYSNTSAIEFIVDANTGEIINEISLFDYSDVYKYTGIGMDNKSYTINLEEYLHFTIGSKKRYKFYDSERKISIADYRYMGPLFSVLVSGVIPGTNPIVVDIKNEKIDMTLENESFIQSAITTMANYEIIYDYYKNVLGRNSYDNKGSEIIVNLGVTDSTFSNDDFNNAAWCSLTDQMYIGNFHGKSLSASLDALAHEFTHGVIEYTANFSNIPKDKDKAFETGALNEGYADVLGSLIEGKNWTLGENNEILRSAENPETYNNPRIKGGENYYPDSLIKNGSLEQFLKDKDSTYVTDYDKGGVHKNSTVVSHAAYLMYEDGAFSSREEMAKVWYNSLLILSPYSNFEDAALAVIKAAKNLGLSDISIYKITKAFQDTNMLEKKDYLLKGTIISGTKKLKNTSIEIYSYDDGSLITSTISDEKGLYEVNLPLDTYNIKIIKEGFKEYKTTITIKGDTYLDIELASKNFDTISNNLNEMCKSSDCVNVTMYFLDGDGQGELIENNEIYTVDSGTILDSNIIIDSINSAFKSDILSSDGKSFYFNIGEFKYEFAWYYRDTNTKFDWNQPINEDIEIEMKLFNGIFDNNGIINESNSIENVITNLGDLFGENKG